MHWKIKGVIQGVLARLPAGQSLNDLMQASLGGRRNLQHHVDAKVTKDWVVHAENLRNAGVGLAGARLVEIGSGWIPVLPLCFSIAGARETLTFDLTRHLDAEATLATLRALERHVPAIAAAAGVAEDEARARWQRLCAARGVDELLALAGITYRAPADATRTGLPDASVDIVISNSVLEHVPDAVLDPLMEEGRRVLKPGGVSIHNVNCGDHYAYFDRNITPIHYLRFGAAEWRWWNNDILFQNRLRPRDFLASAERVGLELVVVFQRPRKELLDQLAQLPIAPEFRHYPPEELCTTSVDFIARKR